VPGWLGLRSFRRPTRAEALDRMDARLQGRPLQSLRDTQAIGDTDLASRAVWNAHQLRMATRAAEAEAVAPDLRVSKRDPYALRYVAALMLAVALLFGSLVRVGSVADMGGGGPDDLQRHQILQAEHQERERRDRDRPERPECLGQPFGPEAGMGRQKLPAKATERGGVAVGWGVWNDELPRRVSPRARNSVRAKWG